MASQTSSASKEAPMSDIGGTLIVDLALVLLVVLMVTASIARALAIGVTWPQTPNVEVTTQTTVWLALTQDGTLLLNGKQIKLARLGQAVRSEMSTGSQLRAVVSADKRTPRGEVTQLIATIKGLGISQFALNVEQEGGERS